MSKLKGIKLLFAGGCHVVGYPVGEEHAFPSVIRAELLRAGIECQVECLAYTSLHHPERVVDACRRCSPDILVLQVGNYELGAKLTDYFRSRIGLKRTWSKPCNAGAALPRLSKRRLRPAAFIKDLLDMLLGRPLVKLSDVAIRLEVFLDAVEVCGVPQVVFTSPTPCFDFSALYYRSRARDYFLPIVERRRCHYLDLIALARAADDSWVGREAFFADSIHLGVAGQLAVGRHIAAYLKGHVLNVSTPASR